MADTILTITIASIIGLLAIYYIILIFFKLKGGLRKGYIGFALGLILGYVSIVIMLLADLGDISAVSEELAVKSLLGVAAVSVALGGMKVYKIIKYIPSVMFEKIDNPDKEKKFKI